MKRTIAFFPWRTCAAALLTMCVLCLAGCSQGSGAAPAASGAEALTESEVDAIAKTAKDGREFMKTLKRKTREQNGEVTPTKPSRNLTGSPR